MPVLLLAKGDNQAKDMLRKAIESRYGLQPPGLESLRIDFKGRAPVKVGPITTNVSVDATARFLFPTAMRWDFAVRPIGVTVQRGTEAFDGTTYRRVRGGGEPAIMTDEDSVRSMQSRLWSIAALLLTPLGELFVTLSRTGENCFEALNTEIGAAVTLCVRENHTLESVRVRCVNPDNDREQDFTIRLSEEQSPIDNFMLPCKISMFWDNDPYYEVEPVAVQSNMEIPPAVFALESD